MSILDSPSAALTIIIEDPLFDEAQLAAVAFLARYSGRTLDAYRHDLRNLFQWARRPRPARARGNPRPSGAVPLPWRIGDWPPQRSTGASPPPAASTASPTSMGGSGPTRPSTFADRRSTHPRGAASTVASSVDSSSPLNVSTTPTPPWLCSSDSTDCVSAKPVRPTSRTWPSNEDTECYGSSARATSPLSSLWSPVPPAPSISPSANAETAQSCRHDGGRLDRRTAHRWVRSIGKRAGIGLVHPHMLRAAFIMAALDAGVPLREVQIAARHADPRTTTVYDRRRQDFDKHAAYVVVAFVAGG